MIRFSAKSEWPNDETVNDQMQWLIWMEHFLLRDAVTRSSHENENNNTPWTCGHRNHLWSIKMYATKRSLNEIEEQQKCSVSSTSAWKSSRRQRKINADLLRSFVRSVFCFVRQVVEQEVVCTEAHAHRSGRQAGGFVLFLALKPSNCWTAYKKQCTMIRRLFGSKPSPWLQWV